MEAMKRTVLFNTHKEYGAKFFEFAGWEMPLEYEGMRCEHESVRNSAGLFDVSHMGEVAVKGSEAEAFVQNLITNDISTIKDDEVIYTPMCYENGGVVDDLLVYKFNNEDYLLVINAGNIDKDVDWILKNSSDYKVEIENVSNKVCQLAIQGPKAQEILQNIVDINLDSIKFFQMNPKAKIGSAVCMISRTGYTGEDGFEIYCENKDVENIWHEILTIGKEDIKPVGLGARDTLRFEACLPLYGNEISKDISPLEGGLSIFVKLNKDNFIGKESLLAQKEKGVQRKLIGFELIGKGIARHGYDIKSGDKTIGFVTTGSVPPTINKAIGLAIIESTYANIGDEIEIVIRKKVVKAKIVKKPFYKKQYKKLSEAQSNQVAITKESEKEIEESKQNENSNSNNEFSYIPATKDDKRKMLDSIGVDSIENLFDDIPKKLQLNRPLNLEESKSELEVVNKVKKLANKNINLEKLTCFLGAGAYDHYIPSLIKHITSRSEFYTAYTPYQAEISQGTLQVIFEFQSMIAELTDMEISNASMYDGATAAVEACIMATVQTKRKKVVVSKTTSPETRKVLETYMQYNDTKIIEVDFCNEYGITDINKLKEVVDKETACVLVQNPNFFGIIESMDEIEKITHENKAMLIMSVDPISLSILKTPGEIGADIVVGEAQSLGNHLNFGGPYIGFMATKSKFARKMPGRIVGETLDADGNKAYVLTLQAREQHVRREKATSNICSNQALNALTASIYMATMGKEGLKEVADLCLKKSHYAYNQLINNSEFEPVFKGQFFKEFVVKSNTSIKDINNKLLDENILGGYELEKDFENLKNSTIICVTEKRSKEEIDKLVSIVEGM